MRGPFTMSEKRFVASRRSASRWAPGRALRSARRGRRHAREWSRCCSGRRLRNVLSVWMYESSTPAATGDGRGASPAQSGPEPRARPRDITPSFHGTSSFPRPTGDPRPPPGPRRTRPRAAGLGSSQNFCPGVLSPGVGSSGTTTSPPRASRPAARLPARQSSPVRYKSLRRTSVDGDLDHRQTARQFKRGGRSPC